MGIRCGHTLRGYAAGIRCGDMLRGYVVGIRWLHRAWVYGGARNVGRCVGVTGMWPYVCWHVGGVCQEHKSVPMTNIVLSLSYLVVMYVYIIA